MAYFWPEVLLKEMKRFCKLEDGDDFWGYDVQPSVNFQDDDVKLDNASSAGPRTGRKLVATRGINACPCKGSSSCSSSEWHFDDVRADEEEQREVRFALSTSKKIYRCQRGC